MKKLLSIILAASMMLGITACSSSTTTTSTESSTAATTTTTTTTTEAAATDEPAEVISMRYAHMNAEDSVSGQMALWFADRVNELTNGGIEIEVFPNSVLGSITEQAEMLSAGTIEFNHGTFGGFSVLYEKLEYLDTPYMTKSVEDAVTLFSMESPIIQDMNEELIDAAGVRMLCNVFGGSRLLTCNVPIYTPDDLAGLKIRAITSQIYITTVEGMGAISVALDFADLPTALATGVVDGQENPAQLIYTSKLHENNKYIMETRHIQMIQSIMMNDDAYASLSAEYQAAIDQASQETFDKFVQQNIDEEDMYLEMLMDEGAIYITEADGLDTAAFEAAVKERVAADYSKYAEEYAQIDEYLGY